MWHSDTQLSFSLNLGEPGLVCALPSAWVKGPLLVLNNRLQTPTGPQFLFKNLSSHCLRKLLVSFKKQEC